MVFKTSDHCLIKAPVSSGLRLTSDRVIIPPMVTKTKRIKMYSRMTCPRIEALDNLGLNLIRINPFTLFE